MIVRLRIASQTGVRLTVGVGNDPERLEEVARALRNAAASVFDFDQQTLMFAARAQDDGSAGRCERDGVAQDRRQL